MYPDKINFYNPSAALGNIDLGAANFTEKVSKVYRDDKFTKGEFVNTAVKNGNVTLARNNDGSYPPYGEYVSPVINTNLKFSEAILSWNCKTSPQAGLAVYVRAGKADGTWSGWYLMGTRNAADADKGLKEDEFGKVSADTLTLKSDFTKFQYKAGFSTADESKTPALNAIAVCHTDTAAADLIKTPKSVKNIDKQLDVPFRSQKNEDKNINSRICGPTSLAMVLDYYGIKEPTAKIARECHDAANDLYGNWAYMVAAASEYGLKGEVRYFTGLDELKEEIAKGRPVVVGIAYDKGDRSNAPFLPATSGSGHMLAISGFDKDGNLWVNDPAAPDAKSGILIYDKDEFLKAWIYKGLGVVLLFSK